jgi:membrane-associated phospholipid phosphatase
MAARRIITGPASRLWWIPLTVAGLLSDRGARGRWLFVPGIVGATAALSTAGKLTVRRPRPQTRHGSPQAGRMAMTSSFPSTHTACAFAIASWVSRSRPRTLPYLLAVGVGYARVHRRAHHLSDVVAGSVVGYVISWSADRAWRALGGAARGCAARARGARAADRAPCERVARARVVDVRRARVAVAAMGAALLVLGGGAVRAWAGAPAVEPGTLHAKVREVCPPPKPGDASCLALALVPAPASAAGARPYLEGGGAFSRGPAGGLTPADLASAYGFLPSIGGVGQTVGVVDAYDDPDIEQDLGTFDRQYGLPACTESNGCFEKVSQTGSATSLPPADTDGWSVEESLDVESAHSVCESCKILLVEADSESLPDLAAAANEAVTLGATEVSNSYGALETEMGESEQAAYDHPGVVVTAASGDLGYLNWDYVAAFLNAPARPNAPASLASVVAVGGTSLQLKFNGARKSELVWNDSGRPEQKEFKRFSATGGGCSTRFGAPSWQQGAPGWASTGCGTKRLANDIAAVADPYTGFDVYDSYSYEPEFIPGWTTLGGTSLSSPLIAALYGLAGGSHGASYPAATLYAHLGESSALYDVTQGGNGYCDGEEPGPCGEPAINEEFGDVDCEGTTACDAAAGFDGPSGVGTPNGLAAFDGPLQIEPTAVTKAASSLTASSALLNATVNSNGAPVSVCAFEYGPTSSYGHSAPCSTLPGSASGSVAVSARITGLAARSLYRFRITATNPYGTGTGRGRILRTR